MLACSYVKVTKENKDKMTPKMFNIIGNFVSVPERFGKLFYYTEA